MTKLISVSGMIGSGKSTFIKHYAQYLYNTYGVSPQLFLEPVESNNLLPLMYEDPKRWTYTSQVRFLVDKLNSLGKALESDASIVFIERDYKEQKIFIEAQLSAGCITPLEYDSYIELYNACARFLPSVLNYHIDTSLETCLYRIQERGRTFESLASNEYYKILYDEYNNIYKDYPESYLIHENVLDIDTYRKLDRFTFEGVYT